MLKARFKKGELVVYPVQGVCEVVDIVEKEIGDKKELVYELRVLDTQLKVLMLVSQGDNGKLRRLISREEAEEIYKIIASDPNIPKTKTYHKRYRNFVEKIRSGEIKTIAEVFRDLSYLKQRKGLSVGERRMLEMTKSLLVKEIALATSSSELEIEKRLEELIQKYEDERSLSQ